MRVLILSGVSGSGKSSYIASLVGQEKGKLFVCSADSFFNKEGGYKFDPSKLGEAHGQCLRDFIEATAFSDEDNDQIVVVDNTNTTTEEIAPYYAIAQAYGFSVELVTLECDPEVAFKRNQHGVSLAGISAMAERIRNRKVPPFWNMKQTFIRTDQLGPTLSPLVSTRGLFAVQNDKGSFPWQRCDELVKALCLLQKQALPLKMLALHCVSRGVKGRTLVGSWLALGSKPRKKAG